MREPANIGFYSNLALLTGLTLSALVPMYFMGSDLNAGAASFNKGNTMQMTSSAVSVSANALASSATSPNASSQTEKLSALYEQIQAEQAEASSTNTTNSENQPSPQHEHAAVVPALPMPVGFNGEWSTVSLDGGKIKLQVLKKAYTLSQTRNKAGAEYFDYAAYLFGQMRQQMNDPELEAQFARLSSEADAMAHHVREASALRFDGTPDESMMHMEVRSGILYHLSDLNPDAMRVIDVDEHGRNITPTGSKIIAPAQKQGRTLARFAQTMRVIAKNPAVQQNYPQTLRVIQEQADMLEALAMNLELRWESVFDCEGIAADTCAHGQVASRMRVYAAQNAPAASSRDMATADAIYQWLEYMPSNKG